jgi:hypothetical protein
LRLVLDTTVLVDKLRGRHEAVALMDQANARGDQLWSVTIVRTEILAGARSGEEPRTQVLLDSLFWLPVSAELADLAGALGRRYRRSRPAIGPVDLVVAASAQILGAELKTLNVRDFPMFPSLQPAY